jgi:hypothetical protein
VDQAISAHLGVLRVAVLVAAPSRGTRRGWAPLGGRGGYLAGLPLADVVSATPTSSDLFASTCSRRARCSDQSLTRKCLHGFDTMSALDVAAVRGKCERGGDRDHRERDHDFDQRKSVGIASLRHEVLTGSPA